MEQLEEESRRKNPKIFHEDLQIIPSLLKTKRKNGNYKYSIT